MTTAQLSTVYLPRSLDAWTKHSLPKARGGELALSRWVCVPDSERVMVVLERHLLNVLRATAKRSPTLDVSAEHITVNYERGRIKLHCHDATAVMRKIARHYAQQAQRSNEKC